MIAPRRIACDWALALDKAVIIATPIRMGTAKFDPGENRGSPLNLGTVGQTDRRGTLTPTLTPEG